MYNLLYYCKKQYLISDIKMCKLKACFDVTWLMLNLCKKTLNTIIKGAKYQVQSQDIDFSTK